MLHKLHLGKKRILYAVCFLLFCLIDQRIKTGSGLDGWIESFRAMTGVAVAFLILPHYRLNEIKKMKIPYLIWGLICVVGGILFITKGQPVAYFTNERVVLAVDALLWGVIVIHTVADIFGKKKRSGGFNLLFSCLWLVMMGLMCISRSAYHWPAAYLVMFGCFYLTDFTDEEQADMFQGMLDGIILSFFLMQGWCFVFRPYDEVRYVGVYNNSNLNALYYLVVLAAVLARLLYVYAMAEGKLGNCAVEDVQAGAAGSKAGPLEATFPGTMRTSKWWKSFYWAGSGALPGFLFLTISRTGWMTAAILIMLTLVFLWRVMQGKTRSGKKLAVAVVKNGLTVVLCFVLLFPAVYGTVRYLPPVFHHPVWFFGEWNEDKIHSWDSWDSEKYVSLDRLFRRVNKRFADLLKPAETESITENGLGSADPEISEAQEGIRLESADPEISEAQEGIRMGSADPEISKAQEGIRLEVEGVDMAAEENTLSSEVSPLQQQLYDKTLAAGYAIDPADRKNAVLVRKAIYRYYFHLLNLTGHPESEQGFQITPDHRIGHAHNIFLQWGVDFGIPAMVLLVVLVVWTVVRFVREFWTRCSVRAAAGVLFMLVPCIFGMLEYAWGAGSLTMAVMFVVWRGMVRPRP